MTLTACVDGEIADAKVADRIMAARGLLELAAKAPRVFDELLTGVDQLTDEDIELIATALDEPASSEWRGERGLIGQSLP